MSQIIQAIYENGILRPLAPLNLSENSIVEIDVRDVKENGEKTHSDKVSEVLRRAGLSSPLNIKVPEVKLSDDERRKLSERFSVGEPLSEIILEEREDRA
jgi:predicted DNA-binding antitoxin AbrB/MazE fold protein